MLGICNIRRILISFILLIPFETVAQTYVQGGAGIVFPSENSFSSNTTSNAVFYAPSPSGSGIFILPNVNWKNHLKTGYEINVAVGDEFCPCLRGEVEFLYQNLPRHINGTYQFREPGVISGNRFATKGNNGLSQTSQTFNFYSLFANAYYDFKPSSTWIPFLGAGIGMAWLQSSQTQSTNSVLLTNVTTHFTQRVPTTANSPPLSGVAFAWQVKAGLSLPIDCHLLLMLQYRLMGTTSYQSNNSTITINSAVGPPGIFSVAGQTISHYMSNSLDINFLYTF